ncbi:uncharacterized protein LOC110455978 [Mizuhopecten yessoensis]|uniref:uncharacterized protein LOC110455978 n=1 Tax=Mizuhopecten yessoensis TaxID=6573 RepID=UPI000B458ADC|nr:uncharacterized protein LOC110455978 [Mizuhopecten yessoensis]
MGTLFHVLVLTSLVAFSHQSEPNFWMKNLLGFQYNSSRKHNDECSLEFSTETIARINQLKADLQQGHYAAIVLHVQIYMNETESVTDIIWTMTYPEGTFVAVNSTVVMTAFLAESAKREQIQANMTCGGFPDNNGIIALDFIGAFLDFLGGSSKSMPETMPGIGEQTCNGTSNCTETCGKAVDEPFLINFTYFWVVIILLYCPNFVYVFYDALHIKADNLTHYHKKDWPYSGKRFLLKLSYYVVTLFPFFRKHLKKRPVTRSILILWIVSIIVQIVNGWLQMSELSSKLAYKEIDGWMYRALSQTMRYHIYGIIVVGGMIITLLLLHIIPTGTFRRLLDDPDIYMLSSTGISRKLFVKKTKLKQLLKHDSRRELTDGQTMIAMHAERFMLLFNFRFWFLLLKESFSGIQFLKTHAFLKCMLLIPVLILCLLFLTLNVVLNLLWGLFPLLGLFFSCLSLVNSWLELFRICFIALYFAFFVLIICGNNLVFVFNIMIYTALYTIPCSSFDVLSKYFMIFPILLYLFFYWTKFTGGYRTMLEYIFKSKLEAYTDKDIEQQPARHVHGGSIAINENLDEPEVTQNVSIEEFDFVCSECSPVRKKILNLLIKTILTGIFMLLTLTVLFLRREVDSFSKVAKTVAFVVIIILPRLIEKFWSSDEEAKKQELEEKISAAVCRWKYEKRVCEKDVHAIELDGVSCSWWNSCCSTRNREASDRNIPTREQEYGLKEGSLSMLSTGTTAAEQTI